MLVDICNYYLAMSTITSPDPQTLKIKKNIYRRRFTFAGKRCQCCAYPDRIGMHLQCTESVDTNKQTNKQTNKERNKDTR